MTVFVVIHYWYYQDADLLEVFGKWEDAQAYVEKEIKGKGDYRRANIINWASPTDCYTIHQKEVIGWTKL